MGQRWDEPTGDPTARQPAVSPDGQTQYPPTVVDGRVTHVSERPPYPPAEGYAPPATWGMYAPSPYGGYANVPPPPEREQSALAGAFPIWLTLAAPLVMLLTLGIAFFAEVFLLGSDWATGALAASLAAFALAVVTVIALIVRVVAGRRALGTVALSALLALALIAGGVAGITQLNPLRHAQAGQYEASHQWQAAIDEYAQAGESAPNAPDIARIYTEWGEALKASSNFSGAAAKLSTVVSVYKASGDSVARAETDLAALYVAWINSGATNIPYDQAVSFLTSYASNTACDSTCQSGISGVLAQAHFGYGQQLAKTNQFKQAITEFELVQSQYATSPYAPQAHAAAAQAYLTLAQQTLTQDCVSALPLYQTLAKTYGDTDQGKQAKAKLAAPVAVTGALTLKAKVSGSAKLTMYLSSRITTSANNGWASHDYRALVNTSTGAYSFSSVKPGKYYPTAATATYSGIYYWGSPSAPYQVTVGPLCSLQISEELDWSP